MYYDPVWIIIIGGIIFALFAVVPITLLIEVIYNFFAK